jgi:transcription initiation factor TFIID TATA-box-binding protein
MNNVHVVNVVGSGSLNLELDLNSLAADIGEPIAQYDPGKYPGMYLRFEENAPLITVYRTGKYIITGADSEEESRIIRDRFLNLLSDMDVIGEPDDVWFSIQNYVCTGELGSTQNLSALAIGLGLENTEYEPEQFPGLIYRPESRECVMLIFATGKVVITGARDLQIAEDTFKALRQQLSELV